MNDAPVNDAVIRRRVLFRGRVQGVGFRATVCDTARRFHVVGNVRNLPDGRVQLLAEGAANELSRFVAAIEAAMQRHIAGYEVDEGPATGEFHEFSIAY